MENFDAQRDGLAAALDAKEFEVVEAALEESVRLLSDGDLSLHESVEIYELGLKLAARCEALLQQAELRVSLIDSEFGSMEPSEDEDDL
ncbi:MAG: exodeoxyribonuclease VII small subunit [Chloroflexota bacterium]